MKHLLRLLPIFSIIIIIFQTALFAQSRQQADKYWDSATSLHEQGRYLEAAQMFAKSADAEANSPEPRWNDLSLALNWAGQCYYYISKYDKAIEYFEQTLTFNKKLGNDADIADCLNSIGIVYDTWGKYDKALEYFEQALTIMKKLGNKAHIATILNNIGIAYNYLGQYNKALEYFEQALIINKKLGEEIEIVNNLNNIGLIYKHWGQYDKALGYLKQALAIGKKLGNEAGIAGSLSGIGGIYADWGKYDKALEYYEQSLAIDRKLGNEADIIIDVNNIGVVYNAWGQYDNAIKNLEESVLLLEKIRKTASGDVRRNYLASQIHAYQNLIYTYTKINDMNNAIRIIELSRAKLLAERVAKSEFSVNIPSVQEVQRKMNTAGAFIIYANADWDDKFVAAITCEKITGIEVSEKDYIKPVLNKYGQVIKTTLANQRGMKKITKKQKDNFEAPIKKSVDFENIINYYRALLTNPTAENRAKAKELGRMFYDFLIAPLKKEIETKKELVIIPDGILAFLPFETFIDETGNYLVEKYNIKYEHSLTVLDLIKNRNYSENRKPMLAFGGAVYDRQTYNADIIENETQLAGLEKNVYAAFARRGSVSDSYVSLGVGTWGNLSGTYNEVKAISTTVKNSQILTGESVTENKVKELSANGELSQYKVIHFATHGLVVPSLPELSALVLSQFKYEKGEQDGYLRMDEIAELDIMADFVNLSACETGLGKIYGGEGVVGLTQSFLIAGANALSVSLWRVDDASTSEFMIGIYKLVEETGLSYAEAITAMKRKFISGKFGETYKNPYYWAPFVYYGE